MLGSSPISCNRQPFLSDQECDRGSVDVHQFDDFPYCESFSPTSAEIPPEIVDTPIDLPIPQACACINIDYALKMKYNQARKFSAAGSFSAKGDCCEGNYVSNLNLEIPCPIVGSGSSKKIKMAIGYGKGKSSMSVSYLRADKDSCAIEAKTVDIDLNIHCPINNPRKRRIKIGISYGKDFNAVSASFIKANPDSCTIEALAPEFKLNIPCPIIRRGKRNPKIRAKVEWGSRANSVAASYLRTDTKECTIEPYDVDLNLEIPCPVKNGKKGNRVKFGIKWGSLSYVSASILKANPQDCTIEANPATFNLEIPCPVKNDEKGNRVKFGIKWGSRSYVSASILKADPQNCTIEANSASFDLEVPCPIKHNGSAHIKRADGFCVPKFRRRWVSASASSWTRSYKSYGENWNFVKINEGSCTIDVGSFNLDIPCPIVAPKWPNKRSIKMGVAWGEGRQTASGNVVEVDSDRCTIKPVDASFNMSLPCPGLVFKTSCKTEGSKGELTITNEAIGGCSRTVTINATFPKGGSGDVSGTVVGDIRYYEARHALQVRMFNLATKTWSEWRNVFTAIGHLTDHVCCNDV